jgi:hypothetical protein
LKTAEPLPTSSVIVLARLAELPDAPTFLAPPMVSQRLPESPVITKSVVVAVPDTVRPPVPVPSPMVEEAATRIPTVVDGVR